MRLLSAILVYFSLAAAALAYPAPYTCTRNFYVSTGGVDQPGCGGNGSTVVTGAATCASMQGANDNIALVSGDCVNFAAGLYNTVTISLTKGGNQNSPSGYVAFVGAPNHGTIINYTGGGYLGLVFNASYTVLDGFDFEGNNNTTDAMIVNTSNGTTNLPAKAHHLIIINNIVNRSNGTAIGVVWNDYYIIAGNSVTNAAQCSPFGESGISVLWPTQIVGFNPTLPWDTQNYHIQILDNNVNNVGYASFCNTANPPFNNAEEADAIITDNWQLQNYCGPGTANACTQSGNPASQPPYPNHGIVAGNVVSNAQGRGINVNNGQNIDVYNNTTYHNGTDTRALSFCEILLGGSNVHIANNIAYANPSAPENGTTLCWIGAYGFSETGTTVFNNDFFNPGGGSGVTVHGTQNDASNLASVTAASSKNLLAVDPLFTSITNSDFHIQANSPDVGAGAVQPTGLLPSGIATNDCQAFTAPVNIGALNVFGGSVISTVPGPVSVVAGGTAVAPFIADAGFNGGTAAGPCACGTIDTSLLTNPIPQGALNFQRYGTFSYVVSGLTPGKLYEDVLLFTEDNPPDNAPGKRLENVIINNTQVLTNFDIFATAGALHKAVQKTFFSAADGNGNMTLQFNGIPGLVDVNAKVDSFQVLNTTPGPVSIAAGGPASAPFIADDGFSGGLTAGPGGWTTDLSGITSPPPANVFQFQRYGPSFYYVINNLVAGQTYTVNLFFSEDYTPDNAANQRLENVTLNGSTSLVGFDIWTAAGGVLHKGVQKTFAVVADAQGVITAFFQVAAGSVDPNAKIDGIQVLATVGNPPVAQNQSASTPFNTAVMINLGNGATNTPTSANIVGTPVGGGIVLNGLTATFTPTPGFSGNASFNFTLSNSNGDSNLATATIAVAGPIVIPPVAIAKNISTQFQTPTTVNLAANAVNNPVSATIQTPPANGTAIITTPPFTLTYTPNNSFSGQDSFTFFLTNSGGNSNVATVNIIVNPQVLATCP